MEAIKAWLLRVHVKEDGLIEHPVVIIDAVEVSFEVVCSRLCRWQYVQLATTLVAS